MSEPKLISPLLDDFAMGAPISSHQGSVCCPALKKGTKDRYIVKIISVPANSKQLDALLLTGVYSSPDDASEYFKEQADGIGAEAEMLRTLSAGAGFISYDGWQIVSGETSEPGCQVYLLGSYKRSLDRLLRRGQITPRDALMLGQELCSSLSACRDAGFLYVDLKPSNIFVTEDNRYCIGDLGFVKMDSLSYTPLPGKYRSAYSPPETEDALHTLDVTADTYSLGMILYQLCNQGKLPVPADSAEQSIASPAQAGDALSRVILKAISPDPSERWKDPGEMALALASCRDEALASAGSETQVFSTESVNAALAASAVSHSASPLSDTRVIPKPGDTGRSQPVSPETRVLPSISDNTVKASAAPEPEKEILPAQAADEIPPEEDYDDLFLEDDEEDEEDDVVRVLPGHEPKRRRKPIGKGWIAPLVILLVAALLGAGAYYYYENYYLQRINGLTVEGMYSQLTVRVDTEVDERLLEVSCTDTYGNTQRQKVSGGKAEFTDLLPNSQYKIHLEIQGYHKLVGKTSDVFNTESRTDIVSFSGITGSEDGSVMLTFTVDGPEPEAWIVTYTAEGEAEKSERFSGHAVTIKGLSVSKLYTFRLSPSEEMYITGNTSLDFTASKLILAQNLAISSCDGSEMTARWDTPENCSVQSWTVRCFSEGGYEQVLETTENKAVFSDIDPSRSYYVEVTAEGMTQPVRTSVTANPITITSLNVNEEDPMKLTVNWSFRGESPEGGWLLMYSLDGSNTKSVVKVKSDSSAEISPRVPGAEYRFEIQAADSTSIFNNIQTYSCPDAEPYTEYSFEPDKAVAYLIATPEKKDWTKADVSKDDYTDQFKVNEKISVLLYCSSRFYIPEDTISVMFVIRDGAGNVDAKLISESTVDWHDLWVHYDTQYGELDVPTVPTQTGDYSVTIYFNGMYVASASFSIVQ